MVSTPLLSAALLLLLLPLAMGVSLGQLDSDTASDAQLTGAGDQHPQRRSAIEELDKWRQCSKEQCEKVKCAECPLKSWTCMLMCQMNCGCECGGHPRGGLNPDTWQAFNEVLKCPEKSEGCRDSCTGEQECEARCELDRKNCSCSILQQAYPAPQRKHKWEACLERRQCSHVTCSECQGAHPGGLCAGRCAKRCECECAGYPGRDLSGQWEECYHAQTKDEKFSGHGTQSCEEAHSTCVKECHEHEQGCRPACDMALIDCRCKCLSATEVEWPVWTKCKQGSWGKWESKCTDHTCSECDEYDTGCADRCRHNCECRCLGISADNMDDLSLQECKIKSGCQSEYKKCQEKCNAALDEECDHSCQLAKEKCHCKCAQTSVTESRKKERVEIIQHCNYIC